MSYTKKKLAMKIDKNGLAYSFISQRDKEPSEQKNIDPVNKTEPTLSWVDELMSYWEKIIEQTSSSIELIKCDRLRMNLPFDDKFKEDFMHAVNTIIGSTVEQFLMSKPFEHTSLNTSNIDRFQQQYQTSALNLSANFLRMNHSDDKLAHHQGQSTDANCSSDTNQDHKPSIIPFLTPPATPNRKKSKLKMPDQQLPKIKSELNISCGSFNIKLPKVKRVSAAAADRVRPTEKNLDNSTHIVPITTKKATKADKMQVDEAQQPKVQQRKRKNMNTTIVGNAKKKRKLNDKMEHTVKQFKCDLCTYSTDQNRSLSRHMRSHIAKRLLQCKICGIEFTQQGNLNAHMKKHADMFTYQCSNCRLGFMQKKPWILHESGCTAKQYECYLCNRKFWERKSDLIRHMRIWHTDERPFDCLECKQKFHLKHELKRHIDCHHMKIMKKN